MKASLFLAFFCLAAVAVTAASAKNIEDLPEYHTDEAVENGDAEQLLWSTCQAGGDWLCDKICRMQGRRAGHCNGNGGCVCTGRN